MEQPQAPAAAEAGAGGDYRIRPLEFYDLSNGFCDLLAQLSPSPPLTQDAFRSRFAELAALGDDRLVLVAEDAAVGAVLVERKFIRRCGRVGHVEDVVVDSANLWRTRGGEGATAYKVILNCTPELTGFYAKCGFVERSVQMGLYF